MELRYPTYYREFACIANRCPDSCCHEWEVEVDEATAAVYQSLAGPLGNDLREALYEEEGRTCLRNREGRCPMWRQDGLCRIQAELGHDALCQVCRSFPRLRHDYGDFLELGLELSCPEAARIILHSPTEFVTETVEGGELPEYDREVMDILRESRDTALALLSDEARPIPQRLTGLLMYAYHIQAQMDGAEIRPFDVNAALAEAEQFAGAGDWEALAVFYANLDLLTERWENLLNHPEKPRWEEPFAAFGRYFVARHWFQAVSDYDLTGRIKLLLSACALLSRLPGALEQKAQLWSKEIENSSDNLYAILDGCYTEPALTDANLLGLMK